MIVKVQMPITSNHKNAKALVYNKDGSFECMLNIDAGLRKLMNGRYKAFFSANVDQETIKLDQEVTDPGW